MKLSEAEKRKLLKDGSLLVPKQISWRRAAQMEKLGHATIYPFHQRWLGRLDITEAGRNALSEGSRK
jgi:hypothetical protein